MNQESSLKEKLILIVDDEIDILDTIEESLEMCELHKADNYHLALQYLQSYSYDVVVLDIMGVNGFDLLRKSVERGFPTIMLTAHALSPESLKKSIKLGAVSFLPKDNISELKDYLEDIAEHKGDSRWLKLFEKLGDYFNLRFGPDWKEKDIYFKELETELINK